MNFTLEILCHVFLGLAIFGVVGWLYMSLAYRLSKPKRAAAWTHISKMIAGTDHWGRIRGSYKGIPVEVFLRGGIGDSPVYYFYHLKMNVGIQGYDWKIRSDDSALIDSPRGQHWYIESKVETLKRGLKEAGIVELVKSDSRAPQVRYRADKGTLEYIKEVNENTYVPTADEFEAQFNLLMNLADINKKVNVWGCQTDCVNGNNQLNLLRERTADADYTRTLRRTAQRL